VEFGDPGVEEYIFDKELIELHSDYPDDHLSRAISQFYYRTGAIADYVNSLSV